MTACGACVHYKRRHPGLPARWAALVFHNAFILEHGRSMIESIPPEIAEKFRADAAASPDNSLMVDADFVARGADGGRR